LDEFVIKKRKIGKQYTQLLADLVDVQLPVEKTDYAENIYWVYGMILSDAVAFEAEEAMARLKTRAIGTRPFFWPMHEQPVFRKMGLYNGESYPVAERMARRGFYVPSGLALTTEQARGVAQALHEVVG
jgi:perosamine synthetase